MLRFKVKSKALQFGEKFESLTDIIECCITKIIASIERLVSGTLLCLLIKVQLETCQREEGSTVSAEVTDSFIRDCIVAKDNQYSVVIKKL